MSLNLASILRATARERPDHPALVWNDRRLTYAELDRAARGIAGSLRERGLVPGDRVALMVPNVPEFSTAYFGILYAGGVVVPLNVLLSAPEVAYHIQDSGAKRLIAHPLFGQPAGRGAEEAGVPISFSDGNRPDDVPALQSGPAVEELHPSGADDTAVILYTSGTTGKPKGAELTHSNLFLNCALVVPKLLPLANDDVALATLPLFHSFGQTCIQNACIAAGGTFTLLPRFTPQDAFEIIQRDRVTLFAGVPTMYFAMLHHEAARDYDLSSLRYCMAGGAPMPVEVMRAFEEKYGVEILEGYGLSETSPVASFNVLQKPRKPGSVGYPVWGVEMAILDAQGQPVADGERGEICIRGHNVMKGYWQRPHASAEAMRDGWFHTGDVGIRDEDGCFHIVDRVKDMILRGGYNVYPREVEEVLYGHPAVMEAAVVGVAHESHGEEVVAVVVLREKDAATPQELIDFCKERLAAYKYPRRIVFRDTLPKGPTGKVLKRELRDV